MEGEWWWSGGGVEVGCGMGFWGVAWGCGGVCGVRCVVGVGLLSAD